MLRLIDEDSLTEIRCSSYLFHIYTVSVFQMKVDFRSFAYL